MTNLLKKEQRDVRQVLESHLQLRKKHDFEKDLVQNYSSNVVAIAGDQVYKGHE